MRTARLGAGLLAGCLVLSGTAPAAPPAAEAMLKFQPRQDSAVYSVPAAQEVASLKVEAVQGKTKGAGWLLKDAQGRPLRRFFDTNYDGQTKSAIDVWSYFQDGLETYRENYVNTRDEPDQMHFRWLNAGGSKWGVDLNKDGKIDTWKAISAEETSQEVVQALLKKDFARLQALLLTEAELKALDLPPEQVRRFRDLRKGAEAKFQATLAKLTHLNEKTHWLHLETAAPHCLPADPAANRADVLVYTRGTVLLETAGKNDWLQTGPMVLVGSAWRLTDAPSIGADADVPAAGTAVADNPELQKLLKQLGELDGDYAKKQGTADVARYNLDRTSLIEKIVAQVKPEEREQWLRQAADCLAAAAQAGSDRTACDRLAGLVTQMEKALPAGHPLLAYVAYRQMQADYTLQISDPKVKDFAKVQTEWLDKLAKFVKTYPTADDAPEALLSLGWVSEMVGKEIEAKNWYQQLVKDFADKPQAAKAKGALRRIDLEGSVLELAGPTLDGSAFDLAALKGKTVIVYYWASWNNQSVGDFAKLKLMLDTHGSKGVELVTVNLDNTAEEAAGFVRKVSAPGTHLYTSGGMESKLATSYGVMMLPNLFLVNKDGKVSNRTVQVTTLEDELKKLLK